MKGGRKRNGEKLTAKVGLTWDPGLRSEGATGPGLHQEMLWTALERENKHSGLEDAGDLETGLHSRREKGIQGGETWDTRSITSCCVLTTDDTKPSDQRASGEMERTREREREREVNKHERRQSEEAASAVPPRLLGQRPCWTYLEHVLAGVFGLRREPPEQHLLHHH